MKIQYKNVCSIRDAQIELEPGRLICIMGESNQGKSALFYSFVDGFTNSTNFKKWINNAALEENPKATAWIGLTDDEGNLWQVEAGTGHLYYRANDTKYEKVGRKGIFELIESQIPGLLYDPEDTRLIMNVQDEDSGLFPIDRSDTQIFKTYERLLSLSCTEDILRTIKLDKEDVDYKVSEYTSSIQKQMAQVAGIENLFDKVKETEVIGTIAKLNDLMKTSKYLKEVETFVVVKDTYVKAVNNRQDTQYKDFDTSVFENLLNSLIKVTNSKKYVTLCQKEFEKINDIDITKVSNLFASYQRIKQIQDEIALFNQEVDKDQKELEGIISILDTIKVCPYCGHSMEE